MNKTLEFWFEFASSYSYLSVMRIEPLARDAGVEVLWCPFLLGPVFLSLEPVLNHAIALRFAGYGRTQTLPD